MNRHVEPIPGLTPSLWDRLQEENGFPLVVVLSLTDRCPLACPHCYITSRNGRGELSTEEVRRLLRELADLGTICLTITGGEPTLRDDLPEILAEAKRLHFAVTLKTSAFLLTRHAVRELRDSGVSGLHVSLYHPDPKAHDQFVGAGGAWEKAVGALDEFLASGGAARASSVLMAWNADVIPRWVDLCQAHGWSYAVDPRLAARRGTEGSLVGLRAGRDQLVRVIRELGMTALGDFEKCADTPLCGAGVSAAYVSPHGEVSSCPDMPLVWGNVRDQSFAGIWRGSPVRRMLREALRWGRSPGCLDCRHLRHCSRCPAQALLEHGEMERPSSFDCSLASAVAAARESVDRAAESGRGKAGIEKGGSPPDVYEEADDLVQDVLWRFETLITADLRSRVSLSQRRVLLTVSRFGVVHVGKMAETIGQAPSTISEMTRRLVEMGLVRRAPSPPGKGVYSFVELTDSGREVLRVGGLSVREAYRKLIRKLPQEDRDLFLVALERATSLLAYVDVNSRSDAAQPGEALGREAAHP